MKSQRQAIRTLKANVPDAAEYLRYVDTITITPVKWYEEIMRLHRQRRVRKLDLDRPVSTHKMEEVTKQEQAVRSSVVAHLVEAKRIATRIERYQTSILTRVTTLSASKLPGSSKTEKRALLQTTLESAAPILFELYDVVEAAEYIIADIDEARVNINRMKDLYALSTRPELH